MENKFKCSACGGSGIIFDSHAGYDGFIKGQGDKYPCSTCKGSGFMAIGVEVKKLCHKCNGLGYNELEPCSCLNGWMYSYRPLNTDEVEDIFEKYDIWHRAPDADILDALRAIDNPTYKGSHIKLIPLETKLS